MHATIILNEKQNWENNLFRNIVGQLRPRHLKTFLLDFKTFVLRCLQYDFIGKFLLYDVNIESLIKLPTSFNLQRSIAFWNSIKYSSRPICVCPRRQRVSLKSPTKKKCWFLWNNQSKSLSLISWVPCFPMSGAHMIFASRVSYTFPGCRQLIR